MKVACPSCGADNPLENEGQEVVCISCFSVWVPDASEIKDEGSDSPDTGEADTFQGHTIGLDPDSEETDPLSLDLGVASADPEEATAFAMEAVALPTQESPDVEGEASWADQTIIGVDGDGSGTASFDSTEGGETPSGGYSYTREGGDIIQEESPFGEGDGESSADALDALSQTTMAAVEDGSSGTEVFGAEAKSPKATAGGADYDDPFADFNASSSASSSAVYDDPFAEAVVEETAKTVSDDPFATDALSGGNAPSGAGGEALGGMEELDFGSLEDGDAGGGGFEVEAAPMEPADSVDVDMTDHDDFEAQEDASTQKGGGRRERARARRRARSSGGKGLKVAGIAFVVLVLLGVGAGQTEMGYFGINLILGDSASAPSRALPPRQVDTAAKKRSQQSAAPDAPTDYVKQIAGLEVKLKGAPNDKRLRQELVRTLMKLQERYPAVYANNAGYAKRLDELLDPAQLKDDKRLLIRKMLVEAKPEDAAAAMEQLVAELTDNPDDLYLMAKVARMQGQDDRALEHYKRALEKNPNFEPALLDMARIKLGKKEIMEAKTLFEKLLAINPNHSEAQVEIAQISLYEKKFEEASTLVTQALETAQKAGDTEAVHAAWALKARIAEAQGKGDERLLALEKAIGVKPKDEATVLALADLLTQQGNSAAALVRLQAAETAGLKSAGLFRALIQSLVAAGKEEEAKMKLDAGLASAPEDTGLLMIQAEEKIRTKHLKTAKAIFAKIIELKPSKLEAYSGLTDILVGEGRISEATQLLTDAVEKVDEKLPLLVKTAELQMQAGATLKAKETMSQILKVDPNNVAVKLRFASLLKGLGIFDDSVRYYEDLDRAGALEPEQILDYAEVLSRLGRRDVAMRQVEAVLSSDPMNVRANILRGHLNTVKGEYRKAAEDLQRALKIKEDSSQALYYIGLNELAQERTDSALSFLGKASAVAPDDLRIRFDLARAYTDTGTLENRRSALAQYSYIIEKYANFTSALDRKNIDPEVYLRRGRLHFKSGQHRKALADFKEAMVLDPVRQDLVIEFARTLQTTGNRAEADAYLREVLLRDKRNPAAHYYLGESLLKNGDTRGAEEHFKLAVAGGGADFPNAYRHLGFLYKEKKLTALACNAFKEYIRFSPATAYDREEIARLVKGMCK